MRIEKSKIVIFGYSKVSRELLSNLEIRDYDYILIENNEDLINKAREKNILSYNIDLAEDKNLLKIGISRDIDALFCMSKDTNLNLFVTFSARKIDKKLKIITLVNNLQDRQKMLLAGADRVVSPYDIGGFRLSRLIRKPTLLDLLDTILFKKSHILRAEIDIPKDSFLDGVYFSEIDIERKYNIIIIGIQDNELSREFIFHFNGLNHKIDNGDILVVLGLKKGIERLKRDLKEKR